MNKNIAHVVGVTSEQQMTRVLDDKCVYEYGFTLAEVLITLGIIGVVASLTVPSLMQKTNDKELEAGFEKSKTVLANGYKYLMAKEDIYSNIMNSPFITKCDNMTDIECLSKYHKEMFKIMSDSNGNLSLSTNYKDTEGNNISFNWDSVPYKFQTNDGMVFGIYKNDEENSIDAVVDINGKKGPNKLGKDLHEVRLTGNLTIKDITDELANASSESSSNNNTIEQNNPLATVADGLVSGDYSLCGYNWCSRKEEYNEYVNVLSESTPVYDDGMNAYYCATKSDGTTVFVQHYYHDSSLFSTSNYSDNSGHNHSTTECAQ